MKHNSLIEEYRQKFDSSFDPMILDSIKDLKSYMRINVYFSYDMGYSCGSLEKVALFKRILNDVMLWDSDNIGELKELEKSIRTKLPEYSLLREEKTGTLFIMMDEKWLEVYTKKD